MTTAPFVNLVYVNETNGAMSLPERYDCLEYLHLAREHQVLDHLGAP